MSESTQDEQSRWVVADLSKEERKFELPGLTDETPIVCYVRLSTLFLYLSKRAFIPNLSCLRGIDSFEGILGVPTPPRIREFLKSLFGRFSDFFLRYQDFPQLPGFCQFPDLTPEDEQYMRVNQWTYELFDRRAIWCWNIDEGPSNAMWHLYGVKGVTIKSTIGLLKKALANSGFIRCLIAPVRYGQKSDTDADVQKADADFDPQEKASWPFWLMRPYLFKHTAYQYEQEIRFVFGIDPKITTQTGGALLYLDSKELIQDLAFSDSIQKDEADVIRELFQKIKEGGLPLKYPEQHQKRWDAQLAHGPAFTAQDDYPELFPDLTDDSPQ